MNRLLSMAMVVSALLVSTAAADMMLPTSGTYDESVYSTNAVDLDAYNNAGNATLVANGTVISLSTFSSDVATAYANDRGGVIHFDLPADPADDPVLKASYGASQSKILTATLTALDGSTPSFNIGVNWDDTAKAVGTSASADSSSHFGQSSGGRDWGLNFDTPLAEVGLTCLNRNDRSWALDFVAILDDASTIELANQSLPQWSGDPDSDTFIGVKAPEGRYITGIRIDANNYGRYDDLAFVAVPEPATGALVLIGALAACLLRRRGR